MSAAVAVYAEGTDVNEGDLRRELTNFIAEVAERRYVDDRLRELARRLAPRVLALDRIATLPVHAYVIRDGRKPGSGALPVYIMRALIDGAVWWKVLCCGEVLGVGLAWEPEPMPSSRTAAFLHRTRFPSPSEALAAYTRSLAREATS